MSWSTSELRVRLAPLNRFKPSSKIFYWPFQGGTSFVDLLCFCSVLCLLCFVHVCLFVLCGHLLGKGLTSWLSFVVSSVSLSLSHWYPGSGVVLDCIDSWSLHHYLLVVNELSILSESNIYYLKTASYAQICIVRSPYTGTSIYWPVTFLWGVHHRNRFWIICTTAYRFQQKFED